MRITLAAAAALLVSGLLSGLLLDDDTGLAGALGWLLRTIVVVAAVVTIVGGLVSIARLRRAGPRGVGWLAAGAAAVAFVWFLAIPIAYGVYVSHLPVRRAVTDADLGAPKQPVRLHGDDGVTVHGWYVPSRNGAAVIALHGTGGNRQSVAGHTRLLVRHGYGVLALDLRGHGESGGRSTSLPWKLDDDIDPALAWLGRRPDVDRGRVGLLGVSLGGEVSLQVAARRHDVRAVVAEGTAGNSYVDGRTAHSDPFTLAQVTVLSAATALLSGEAPSSDSRLIERIAPTPLLLISAGRSLEAATNRGFAERAGGKAEHWNLPDASHATALRADPAGYEQRVVGFLDRSLQRP